MSGILYHDGKFPPARMDFERLMPLVGPANASLARYDGLLQAVPNAKVLLSPLTAQEAVFSSRIEGTQATLEDVLEFEASPNSAIGEKRDDILEVLNYRAALVYAVEAMERLPLSQRLLRDAHGVLMQGVRGQNKTPGEYRKIPNWIGIAGGDQQNARFIPPGAEKLPDLMSSWERYLHSDGPDGLIQLAVLHAEFEAIHPFLDGNGRLGRLLVPLFLVFKKLLGGPHFYISEYLEANRDEYYDRLLAISRDDDWTGWCEFFLTAVEVQATNNASKARAILELYQRRKGWIAEATHSQYAVRALDWFFQKPWFEASDFVRSAGIPEQTARSILRKVREEKMLVEARAASGRRPAFLVFAELFNIAEGKAVFEGDL